MLLLLLATVALKLPSFYEPFEYNTADRAYGALLILEGHPLYTVFHSAHQLPAAYYVYALGFRLFGVSYFALKAWIALAIVLEAALLYALGRRLGGARVGLIAAFLFAVFVSDPFMEGTTGEIELFSNLPRIASVLLLWLALAQHDSRRRWWLLAASGAATCVAFWFKASYLLGLGVTGLLIVIESLRQAGTLRRRVQALLAQCAAVVCGVLAVAVPVLFYFAIVGALPGLVQVFTMGFEYIEGQDSASPTLVSILVIPIAKLLIELWFLVSLALFGLLIWMRSRKLLTKGSLLMCLWVAVSFAEANTSLYPYRYYDLLVIPALALVAAHALSHLARLGTRRLHWNAVGAALLIVAAPLSIYFRRYEAYSGRAYLNSFAAYRLGWISRSEYLTRAIGSDGFIALQTEVAGDYVRERTSLSERVYVWMNEINFYFVSRRSSPIRYIWPNFVGSPNGMGPPVDVPEGWERLQRQIFEAPAVYIAVFRPGTEPAWLQEGLDAHYTLETTIMGVQIYRWTSE
jgi:hypothetical protein